MLRLPSPVPITPLIVLGLVGTSILACAAPSAPASSPARASSSAPAAAAQVAASAPAAPREPRHATVAYPTNVVTMTGFYIAVQEGYTTEEGIDAEMVRMNGTLSAQGIVAKQVDFGMSAGALLAASLRGAPIRNVFVQMDKPLFYLFAQPEVNAAVELEGKPVGIAAVGDSTHLALKAALRGLGADPERVTYAANLTGVQAVTALQSGAVTGATVSPPNDLLAERLGFRKLAFMGDYLDYLTSGLATHEETIQTQPEFVLAVVRAELKAHRYMQQNRAGTVQHMMRFQEISQEDAEFSYDTYMRYLTRDGTSTPEVLERILRDERQALQEQGVDTRATGVDEMFQLALARQANEQLDREGWRPRS